jgi:hypothetical protein
VDEALIGLLSDLKVEDLFTMQLDKFSFELDEGVQIASEGV